MAKIKEKFNSVRFKLFFVICAVITSLVISLIVINSIILENFYTYAKINGIKDVYQKINNYYRNPNLEFNLDSELKKIAFKNNFDILIKTKSDLILFSTDRDFFNRINEINKNLENQNNIIYKEDNVIIRKIDDENTGTTYILLTGKLVNGYELYIRIPIAPIEESARISNNLLILIGLLTVLISSFIVFYISRKFAEPITQLNDITNRMAKLDFSQKYRISDSNDEINKLGKNINYLSDKLEKTITELKESNIELEKDIEEKSKIDQMRKQFISDVSHELKTPIALIQGYAEGLVENVNADDESRKFYAEVILDESNKMDKLVKQLLELMKLEYGNREFNDKTFDIIELINEVIRKCNVIIQEQKIDVIFNEKNPINVLADEFYIEQVITNYLTNAIKNAELKEGKKQIKISIEVNQENKKARIYVFNTGEKIEQEDLERIWGRFYKVDTSRNRENGGSGIGLALVKAIQNNYKNEYGVRNLENGVEFYFNINLSE